MFTHSQKPSLSITQNLNKIKKIPKKLLQTLVRRKQVQNFCKKTKPSHVQCHRLIFTVNYNWFVVVILQLNCYHSWNIFANYLATPYSHNYSFSTSLQIAPNAISTNKEGTQIVVGGRNCKWRFTIGILIRDVTKVFIDQWLDS